MYLKWFTIFVLGAALLWAAGCGGKTDEDVIRDTLRKTTVRAEKNDVDGVLETISENYSDDENRTKDDVEELLAEYMGRFRGITVNLLDTRFVEMGVFSATVETDVAFSSGAGQLIRKIARVTGRSYRFKLEMKKENDDWKVTWATWELLEDTNEISKESLKAIEKVLPDL